MRFQNLFFEIAFLLLGLYLKYHVFGLLDKPMLVCVCPFSTERTSAHGQAGRVGYQRQGIHILISEQNMSDAFAENERILFLVIFGNTGCYCCAVHFFLPYFTTSISFDYRALPQLRRRCVDYRDDIGVTASIIQNFAMLLNIFGNEGGTLILGDCGIWC